MLRREFIVILGGMFAWPTASRAQTTQRVPRIGYLMDRSGPGVFDEGFLSGLREHGYTVGRNIAIEFRWTEGKSERLPALVDELVALKVELIVTAGAQAVQVAKKATSTIPIVMTSSQDAVGDGLVASLARPGGNVTGRSSTPRLLDSIAGVSGILDRPPSRAMTAENLARSSSRYDSAISRRNAPEVLRKTIRAPR